MNFSLYATPQDRGASGCVLITTNKETAGALSGALKNATKTYVALCRGTRARHDKFADGTLSEYTLPGEPGAPFPIVPRGEGWFLVDRAVEDMGRRARDAQTLFRPRLSSMDPRCCLMECRPLTGRWHQIRRHLNGISAPIVGDPTHGSSSLNKEWRKARGWPTARLGLHLESLVVPETELTPEIDVTCTLPADFGSVVEKIWPGKIS